jgi:hypothetical protein
MIGKVGKDFSFFLSLAAMMIAGTLLLLSGIAPACTATYVLGEVVEGSVCTLTSVNL